MRLIRCSCTLNEGGLFGWGGGACCGRGAVWRSYCCDEREEEEGMQRMKRREGEMKVEQLLLGSERTGPVWVRPRPPPSSVCPCWEKSRACRGTSRTRF